MSLGLEVPADTELKQLTAGAGWGRIAVSGEPPLPQFAKIKSAQVGFDLIHLAPPVLAFFGRR